MCACVSTQRKLMISIMHIFEALLKINMIVYLHVHVYI